MLRLMDVSLHIVHLGFIGFSLLGWLVPSLVEAHLIAQGLVFLSWFGLGLLYFPGYCVLTGIHWHIRSKRGIKISTDSYLYWLMCQLTPNLLSEAKLNNLVMITFFGCTAISLVKYWGH